ncbi:MAG: HD domain-containing protein [Eubacteriales bacterium]|nr:HD domain-containing protein [Eubacteriales bacterium]
MPLEIAKKLKNGVFDGVAEVAELKKSPCCKLLLRAYERLDTARLYESDYHGPDHIGRVMLLGAIIAMQQRFSERETELLLIACGYHDIGRINDYRDEEHGRRAADMLPGIPGLGVSAAEMACIQSAVATHSTNDEKIDAFATAYGVTAENEALCRRLCRGLKDADNLDRVRIGDLDTRHLRFSESKHMKPAAEAVCRLDA